MMQSFPHWVLKSYKQLILFYYREKSRARKKCGRNRSDSEKALLRALVLYGAGTLVSPEGLAELLESRPMKLLGFRAEDAWKTIAWFQKKGQRAVLLGRCIPIIRSLISVPAGMAGMKMPGFLLYTIVGSTVWNLLLVGIGAAVGAAWEQAAEYVKLYADVVFFVLIVGTVCFPAFHLYRKKHRQK